VRDARHPWALAALPKALPVGRYRLHADGLALDPEAAALSWELGSYSFDRYKPAKRAPAELMLAPDPRAERGLQMAAAVAATRDLVNTPAEAPRPGGTGRGGADWWPSRTARSSARPSATRC
jgi:leucyl aminopeptidase